jgi:stress response protein SCP2
MTTIQRGSRCKLEEYLNPAQEITVECSITGPAVYDYCCFGVDAANKLSDDRYMVFYNQTSSPAKEITLEQGKSGVTYHINLAKLPASINKLVFTASIDGDGAMSAISACAVNIGQGGLLGGGAKVRLALAGSDFHSEKAIILIEVYKKDVWRLAAVASGFNGGLGDLLKAYGGEQLDDAAPPPAPPVKTAPPVKLAPPPKPAPVKISLEKKLEKSAPSLVSLAKPLKVSLEKHKLTDVTAKVGLVLDISGSMSGQYANGTVQKIVNKMLPVAVQFDDDGDLDFWYYGSEPRKMKSLNMKNYQKAVPKDWNALMSALGGGNDETKVMKLVMSEYSGNIFKKPDIPAFVIFVTDGGIATDSYGGDSIESLLIKSSKAPIFWQFVGVGGWGYGALEQLDTMSGRYVDNANFFALDDFNTVPDSELYDRLLGEFPSWLAEIKKKGML